MKRAIVILTAALFIFILWGKFSTKKTATNDAANRTTSDTNSDQSRSLAHGVRRNVRPSDDSTNAPDTDADATVEKKLSREQVEAYLVKTKRSAESLLNAFTQTGDTNFLAEAVQKYPDNSIVQWTMLNRASPEERSQWLEKLKTSSPNNGLPNYLSALDKFKSGNAEQGLAEMDAASKKTSISSFDKERSQSREEMYLLSGYSPVEAKERGMQTVTLDALSQMKQLAQEISALQKKYKAAGDNSSANELAAAGIEVGQRYANGDSSSYLINQLVGYAMENIALNNLDAGTYYSFLGKTAGDRIQEIKDQKQETKDVFRDFNQNYSNLSDAEKIIYWNRTSVYGELNAMRWLKKTYGSAEPK